MIFLLLGAGALVALLGALGMFSKAQVKTVKALGVWVVGIGALLAAALLFFTGRWFSAAIVLVFGALMSWTWVMPGPKPSAKARPGRAARGGMSREEAYAVLGLQPGADAEAVKAAYHRLMRTAHPDQGGSDWLASRINQARDVLLG